MRGVQQTLIVIVVLALLAVTIGVLLGALAGYYGRWVDTRGDATHRGRDDHPAVAHRGRGRLRLRRRRHVVVAIVLGIFSWTGLSRLRRAEFLALRERGVVDAARVAGASNARIIFKHILPNSIGVIVVAIDVADGCRHPHRVGPQLPRLRRASAGRVARPARRRTTTAPSRAAPWLFVWPGGASSSGSSCASSSSATACAVLDPRQKRIPKRKDLETSHESDAQLARANRTIPLCPVVTPRRRRRRARRAARRRAACRRATSPAPRHAPASGRPGSPYRGEPPTGDG